MKKRLITILSICALSSIAFSFPVHAETDDSTRIEALEQKVAELEQRIATLEGLLSNSNNSENIVASSEGTLEPGAYIVGEDIPEGKYSFSVIRGEGELLLFLDYNTYKTGDRFDAFESYDMASQEYINQYQDTMTAYAESLSTEVGNVHLESGDCLNVDGVTLSYKMQ